MKIDFAEMFKAASTVALVALLCGCHPAPGPDKQFSGMMGGAVTGAGAGAVTGFQVGSGTGPGAAVGAGLGAVIGAARGAAQDDIEDQMFDLAQDTQQERATAVAREILADHYARRIELHPTRDIFPGDLFFRADTAKIKPTAKYVVREIARMNKERLPWSRLVVASYVKSSDPNATFAQKLAEQRSKQIVNELVHAGLEPRRLEARGVVISAPVLIDPTDDPLRYSQAVELIPLDR